MGEGGPAVAEQKQGSPDGTEQKQSSPDGTEQKQGSPARSQPAAPTGYETLGLSAQDLFTLRCALCSDKGSGLMYNSLNEGKVLYVYGWEAWLQWRGYYWEKSPDDEAKQLVEAVADAYAALHARLLGVKNAEQRSGAPKERLAWIEALARKVESAAMRLNSQKGWEGCLAGSLTCESRMAAMNTEMDMKKLLLPTPTGVVDMRTGQVRESRQSDLLTRHTRAEWRGLDEPCPKFQAFLEEILGGDRQLYGYMQKVLGKALAADNTGKEFFVCLGEAGNNGKTMLFEILKTVLSPREDNKGGFAGALNPDLFTEINKTSPNAPNPSDMELRGMRIAYGSEPDGSRFSIAKVKKYTGGDTLIGRDPYDRQATTFSPTHTLFLLANTKLHASAAETAFWNRMRLISFPVQFVDDPNPNDPMQRKANPLLRQEILEEESSGILAWLVRGYMLYLAEGLKIPESVRAETSKWKREENLYAEFAESCLEQEDGMAVPASDLYQLFRRWYEENIRGKCGISSTAFGRDCVKAAPEWFRKVRGSRVVYVGVNTKDDPQVVRLAEDVMGSGDARYAQGRLGVEYRQGRLDE